MKVAIQGERGSFSHQAASVMVPKAQVSPCARSIDVFDALDEAIESLVSGFDPRFQDRRRLLPLLGEAGGDTVIAGQIEVDDAETSGA